MFKRYGFKSTIYTLVAALLLAFPFAGCSLNDKTGETNTIDMGTIGNKINVDGTVAYVAGENKILVPYNFYGDYSTCSRDCLLYTSFRSAAEISAVPVRNTSSMI